MKNQKVKLKDRTGVNLKADMLETLMFVAMKGIDTALHKRCLAIIGI